MVPTGQTPGQEARLLARPSCWGLARRGGIRSAQAHFRPAVQRLVARGRDPHNTHPSFRAELAGLRAHDMRHTFASLLVVQGVHPKEMAEQMGHASVQITLDRYSHIMPHLGARIAKKLDAAYRDVTAETGGGNVVNLR